MKDLPRSLIDGDDDNESTENDSALKENDFGGYASLLPQDDDPTIEIPLAENVTNDFNSPLLSSTVAEFKNDVFPTEAKNRTIMLPSIDTTNIDNFYSAIILDESLPEH